MRWHDVQQNTTEWLHLRAGIPTSSEFDSIITPAKGELAKGETTQRYMAIKLYEHMLGVPWVGEGSKWMERGHQFEGEAVANYEFQTGRVTLPGGFFTTNDGMVGSSPDRRVEGGSRTLEIKVPMPVNHVYYMLTGSIEAKYKPQLQGQLYVCEADKVDIVSHCTDLPAVIIEVGRDEDYIGKLKDALDQFVYTMLEWRERLAARFGPFPLVQKAKPLPKLDDKFTIGPEIAEWVEQGMPGFRR